MAKISAFKGWRYNTDNISNIEDVIVPPYDVITPEEQEGYYNKSPHNYIRINLNNSHGKEKYFSAANFLNMWIGSGILVEESKPAIYILSQSFSVNGKKVERVGCICALTLSDLGDEVLPHEQTIDKHLDDRYNLMESTSANSGQIFMCYDDHKMVLENIHENLKNDPSINAEFDDISYKLWAVTDTKDIDQFINGLSDKKLVIADGHHRYKTALKYSKNNTTLGSDKVMVTLVNSRNSGMDILPTHRVVKESDMTIETVKENISEHFSFEECNGAEELLSKMEDKKDRKCILGLYHRASNVGLILEFNSWSELENTMSDKSKNLRELDTNILHTFLLKDVFNIDTNNQEDLKYLSYLRGNKSPVEMLQKQKYEFVCFVNPPSLDDVFSIAEGGEVMPQKSTYFFPKVYSGLVTRCF
tara:strand:+ start:511 stop:1761 length:1251 start_codon:yes stop_codon:yes gene_type:complete